MIQSLAVDPRENSYDTDSVLKEETLVIDGIKLINIIINYAVRTVSLHSDMENTRKPVIILVEVDNLDKKKKKWQTKKVLLRNSNKYRDVYMENNILVKKEC